MSQVTRDNHFVPQAYLRRWSDGDGKVWCRRLLVNNPNVPEWRPRPPRALAFQTHLYTKVVAGAASDEVETWLEREFETPGQEAISKIVTDRRMTANDWAALIRYTASQDVRTPARYSENVKRWNEELPKLMSDSLRCCIEEWEAASPEERKAIRASSGQDPNRLDFPFRVTITPDPAGGGLVTTETIPGRRMWLASIQLALKETIRVLHQHRWSVMLAPQEVPWLTSDDPVVRLNYTSEREYNFGGGWGSKGSEFLFPLSPTHLLYTQIGHRHPARISPDRNLALRLQRIIAEHAHRWLYASAPLSKIGVIRARTVDAEMFASEARAWQRWHDEQSAAELSLQSPTAV